jgi:hypothetical protein
LLVRATIVAVKLAHSQSSSRSIKLFTIIVAVDLLVRMTILTAELFFCDHHHDWICSFARPSSLQNLLIRATLIAVKFPVRDCLCDQINHL